MKSLIHNMPALVRLVIAALLLRCSPAARGAAVADPASDFLRLDMTADRTSARIDSREVIQFRIRYTCSSLILNANNAVITDVLDTNLELVSITGSAHTSSANFSSGNSTARFVFVTPLPAGSTGELFIQARFKDATPGNTVATNQAVFTAGNATARSSNQVAVTGTHPVVPPTFTRGLSILKRGTSSITTAGPTLYYDIRHGNTGSASAPLGSYVVEDSLPAGTSLEYFGTEAWPGTNVSVTVRYKTNLNGSWRQWGAGPLYHSGQRTWFYADNIGLPATEWVTALRWEYGTLPGGGRFLPENMDGYLDLAVRMRNPASFTPGTPITNCATASATGYSQTSCVSTAVTAAAPRPYLNLSNHLAAHGEPYAASEVFQARLSAGVQPDSSTGMTNPVLYMVLPPEIEYAGAWRMGWWPSGSPQTAPVFTRTDNFRASGQTLLTFSWQSGNPITIPANASWNELMVEADVRARAAVPNGDYRIAAWGKWATPGSEGHQWFGADTLDVDGDGNVTERLAKDTDDITIRSPGPEPYFRVLNGGMHAEPWAIGETFEAEVRVGVRAESTVGLDDPITYLLLPPQFEFTGTWRMGVYATGSPSVAPVLTRVDDFGAPGQTLLSWSWQAGNSIHVPRMSARNYMKVIADIRVRSRTVNGDYPLRGWATWRSPAVPSGILQSYETDALDVDGDSNTAELFARSSTTVDVLTGNGAAGLQSTMFVKGELDAAWNQFPAVGQTVPGGKADYELRIRNIGGVVMRNVVVVDILPVVGDTGVIDLSPRGSLWSPFPVGAVTAPAGVTVLYSTSSNPCRPELVPSGPPGCQAPNWTSTAPADITTVRSLKFDLTGLDVFPGDEIVLAWPMRAPWGAPTAGEVAWNSFGFVATRADNGDTLLASEPVKTGIAIRPPLPPYFGDFVWLDADRDGVQDSGESGINGVRVELFRDNGDGIASPASDTFVAFTATTRVAGKDGAYLFGNMGPGSYFAVFYAPPDTGVTSADRTADDADSDGQPITYRNRRAAITPVTRLDALEEDRSWDQGFYSRSGIPAVWAVAHYANGSMIIGGQFAKSHGVDRNKIARLDANGNVDASFNPGAGFNGPVRSVALRSDGMVWVGGNFSGYNGKATMGVALLSSSGTFDSRPARPDTQEVNWVAADGTKMYLAGAFGKVGGVPAGNVARLNGDGSLDSSFAIGPGANGTIYGGAVLPSGKVILVGAFSQFNGYARRGVVQVNSDGSVDTSFDPLGGAAGDVYSLKCFDDGRMLLTGNFRTFNGTVCNGMARLLPDGRVDTSLQPSELSVESINSSH